MKARHEFENQGQWEKYLRVEFAKAAMQGRMASAASSQESFIVTANVCWEMADAMIAAANREPK